MGDHEMTMRCGYDPTGHQVLDYLISTRTIALGNRRTHGGSEASCGRLCAASDLLLCRQHQAIIGEIHMAVPPPWATDRFDAM